MVDPATDVFYGPHRVQSSGTISIPRELLRELRLEAGTDQAHWALNPDVPGTLVLIPDSLLTAIMANTFDLLRPRRRTVEGGEAPGRACLG